MIAPDSARGVSTEQLDAAYASGPDPWQISQGFYESRKRGVLLNCLPRPHYGRGFEPGCAAGELTVALAQRCDSLLAVDYHEDAVAQTRARVSALPGCTVEQRLLPAQWPLRARFDLVVVAEFGYYLDDDTWAAFCARLAASLRRGATVAACHWRHDFEGRTLSTQALHARLDEALPIRRATHVLDDDFVLDVWSGEPGTLAGREGRR